MEGNKGGRKTITAGMKKKKVSLNMDQELMNAADGKDIENMEIGEEVDDTIAEEMRLKTIAILEAEIKEEQEKESQKAKIEKEKKIGNKKLNNLMKKMNKLKKQGLKKAAATTNASPKTRRLTAVEKMKGIKPLSVAASDDTAEPAASPQGSKKESSPKKAVTPADQKNITPSDTTTTNPDTDSSSSQTEPKKQSPSKAPSPSMQNNNDAPDEENTGPTAEQRAAGVGVSKDEMSATELKSRRLSMNIALDAYAKTSNIKKQSMPGTSKPNKKSKKKNKLGKRAGNLDAKLLANAGEEDEEIDMANFEEVVQDMNPKVDAGLNVKKEEKSKKADGKKRKKFKQNKDAKLLQASSREATIEDLPIEEVVDEAELQRQREEKLRRSKAGVGKKLEDLSMEELMARRRSANIGLDAYKNVALLNKKKKVGGKKKKKRQNKDALLLAKEEPSESAPALPPRKSQLNVEAAVKSL